MASRARRELINIPIKNSYQMQEICNENFTHIINLETRGDYLIELYPNLNNYTLNIMKELAADYETFIGMKAKYRDDIYKNINAPIEVFEIYATIINQHDLDLQKKLIKELTIRYK